MFKIILFILTFTLFVELSTAVDSNESKIQPKLRETVRFVNGVNILVKFTTGTAAVFKEIEKSHFESRDLLLTSLSNALRANSDQSQTRIRSFLQQGGFKFDPLWITDQLFVEEATEQLISDLISFPEVAEIIQDEQTLFVGPIQVGPVINLPSSQGQPKAEWGVDKVMATQARNLLTNTTSYITRIRVATIDTGVRGTHFALRDNYLGNYGWFDPYLGTAIPNDQNGHGTHTTGTIVGGANGIGVYPEAQWMACKGCNTSYCGIYSLVRCGQFVLCPTHTDGSNPDCSKAPHVVSNSWGIDQGNHNWFDGVIDAWQVGRITPVFSIGNSGPSCGTAGYPGSLNVIGVGSTTITDAISSFSSIGPAIDGKMKPDVCAPGSNVVSASHTADNAYVSLSGTSMAAPHVAGVSGILLAFNPNLSFNQLMQNLFIGADRALQFSGRTCEGIADNIFPNHSFGYGRINALSSLQNLVTPPSVQ